MIQIAGISSMATRQILADLTEHYERRSGCQPSRRSVVLRPNDAFCTGEAPRPKIPFLADQAQRLTAALATAAFLGGALMLRVFNPRASNG
jgi:hypothetical protein